MKKQFITYIMFEGIKCYIDAETHTMGVDKDSATVFEEGDSILEIETSWILTPHGKVEKEWLDIRAIFITENFSIVDLSTEPLRKYAAQLDKVKDEVVFIVNESFSLYSVMTSEGLIRVPKNYLQII